MYVNLWIVIFCAGAGYLVCEKFNMPFYESMMFTAVLSFILHSMSD